jgi:hypothetical protein
MTVYCSNPRCFEPATHKLEAGASIMGVCNRHAEAFTASMGKELPPFDQSATMPLNWLKITMAKDAPVALETQQLTGRRFWKVPQHIGWRKAGLSESERDEYRQYRMGQSPDPRD